MKNKDVSSVQSSYYIKHIIIDHILPGTLYNVFNYEVLQYNRHKTCIVTSNIFISNNSLYLF